MTDLSGAETISADTGSGDVRLAGNMSQIRQIEIILQSRLKSGPVCKYELSNNADPKPVHH